MSEIMIPLACCKVGDILADDVTDEKGVTIVAQNTVINQYIKDKLIDLKIPVIWLYQPLELMIGLEDDINYEKLKKTYKGINLSIKRVLNDISAGCMIDYEKVVGISKLIFSDIKENRHITKYISGIKEADEYTYTHSTNVAFYSMLIAKALNFPEHRVHEVIQAGLLHDIGKLMIPNEILNKKGKLTHEEFELIKKHPILGYNFIKDIPELSESVKKAVLLHHERIDGSGYPYGLSGDSTELIAKIISIADVYDAMTQNRVYKNAATPFEAFEMFLTTGKLVFDSKIVDVFLKNTTVLFIGAIVKLSNGDTGEVVYFSPQDISSPIVRVESQYIDLSKKCGIKVLSLL